MAVDRSFRRIVFTLMTLVTISVITVGLYLYFNFTARSTLHLIVPDEIEEFAHFQTKKMRDNAGIIPSAEYVELLSDWISSQSYFQHIDKPSEPGIGLFTDVVYFRAKEAECVALSLTSPVKFKSFLDTLKSKGMIGNTIEQPSYNYIKIPNSRLYLAYKYKAMVLMKSLADSAAFEIDAMEGLMGSIFDPNKKSFIQNPAIQALYEVDCQWVYASKKYGWGGISAIDGKSTHFKVEPNSNQLKELDSEELNTQQWIGVEVQNIHWFDALLKRVCKYLINEEYGY
jgi:hypothetical protein